MDPGPVAGPGRVEGLGFGWEVEVELGESGFWDERCVVVVVVVRRIEGFG